MTPTDNKVVNRIKDSQVEEATMPANNLPKMPDYFDQDLSHMTHEGLLAVILIHRRACYLAGIEAARGCVGGVVTYTDLKGPEHGIPEHNAYNRGVADGMNGRRESTLANLETLSKSVAGKPADALVRE